MYWNIMDEERVKLLKKITDTISLDNYYMIGGTALSLQLNLRESFDFDFCVQTQFNNDLLLEELRKLGSIEVNQNQKGTLDVILDNVQVSFFYYPNPIINNFIITDDMPNLRIASVMDIAIMKLTAIGGRGAKKDFFDLYEIIKIQGITEIELANRNY